MVQTEVLCQNCCKEMQLSSGELLAAICVAALLLGSTTFSLLYCYNLISLVGWLELIDSSSVPS